MNLIKPRTRTLVVPRETDGTPAGVQIEHWSGRVDARVFARPVVAREVVFSLRDRFLVDVLAKGPFTDPRKFKRAVRRADQTGAVTASGLFLLNWIDVFDASQMAYAYLADSVKYALFTNLITPNFSTNTAYGSSPYNANEVSGTGYTAGGVTLGTKTVSESPTGTLMFDAADPAWTTATFLSVRCGVWWDDTITTPTADPVMGLCDFTADFAVTAGTLTVQLASAGLHNSDLTP